MSTSVDAETPLSRGRNPVSVRRPDPVAWAAALQAADGDPRRLQLEEDGTVTVLNAPRSTMRPNTFTRR